MIKTAEEAYMAGRQAAMEKISMFIIPGALANFLGAEEAKADGNKRARISVGGVLAPLGYTVGGATAGGLAGGLLGAGTGLAIDAFRDRDNTSRAGQGALALGLGALGGAGGGILGGLGGYGYGLYRGYKIPGEY